MIQAMGGARGFTVGKSYLTLEKDLHQSELSFGCLEGLGSFCHDFHKPFKIPLF
jgi:hypothetical protein